MSSFLYFSTHGPEDPRRAALPFVLAMGAIESGHGAAVCLACGATSLLKEHVAKAVHPANWPTLEELMATASNCGVEIFALPDCAEQIGLTESELLAKHARLTNARAFAALCADAQHVISV